MVILGGAGMAFMAGIHFWWPKVTGQMYSEAWSRLTAVVVLIAVTMTFIPQFFLGAMGAPRRSYNRFAEYALYEQISDWGAVLLGAGMLMVLVYLFTSLIRRVPASRNPWEANTLEWQGAGSPPEKGNFNKPPVVKQGPYEFQKEIVK
jgi:cytochrome c oxidase subunit 1